ncbi:uncharacterized protein LOC144063991 isoform X1 [Vanacampus margaritifer]
MRFLATLFVVLAAAALQSAFSASLQSAEKDKKVNYDTLTELRKIDQLEFEAAQKNEAAQLNITEKQEEDGRYLEAATDDSVEVHSEDSVSEATVEVRSEILNDAAEGGRSFSDAAAAEQGANCQSSEEMVADEQQQQPPAHPESTEDDSKDSTKEQDELE